MLDLCVKPVHEDTTQNLALAWIHRAWDNFRIRKACERKLYTLARTATMERWNYTAPGKSSSDFDDLDSEGGTA